MAETKAIQSIDYRSIPLFSELEPTEVRSVLAEARVKNFARGAIIFHDGDAYTGFYIVLSGQVKVYKDSRDGKQLVLHVLRPNALLAEVPMFEGGRYPANAIAMERSSLLFLPKDHFLDCLDSSPQLMRKILVGCAKKIRMLTEKLENLTLHDVTGRLARLIVREIVVAGRTTLSQPFVKLTVPKAVIASQLGTVRETFSRSFKKLQEDEVIKVKGQTVTVLDYARLRDIAQ